MAIERMPEQRTRTGRKSEINRRPVLRLATALGVVLTACRAKVTPPTPELIATNEPVPTAYIPTPIPTEIPQAKEIQIAPSPAQESMENILLTSVKVMTEKEIQTDPLLSDLNFQEGINNYVQEAREIRSLSEESTTFELVVIRGTTTEGNEMLFPFAAWIAQNQEGLTFVEMIGETEEGALVEVTLEHQEIEKDGILYYALVLQDRGPIFAIPASEIDNPEAEISFSPSGQALEETESISVSKVLFALVSGTEQVVELDEETIKEFARKLNCTRGSENACVGRSYSSSGFRGAALEAISTGVIKTIDILQPENGNKIAEAEVVVFVTKDLEGNPQLLNIVAQLRPVETPEINVYHWPNWLAKKDFNNSKPYSREELKELYMKGGNFNFAFYDKDYQKDVSYTEIMRIIYSDENYIEQLQQFINNKGYLGSEELLILPSSVVLTFGMVPSATPTEQAVELDEKTIEELARNLHCQGDEGCVNGGIHSSSGFRGAALEAISTGVIKTIDILQPENGNKIAEAEVAVFVTKDLEGSPQLLNVVVQLRPVETLEINVYVWPNLIAGREGSNTEPYSIEELEELYTKSRKFRMKVYDKDYEKDYEKDFPWAEIMSEIYSDVDYIEQLQQFIDSNGYIESKEPLFILSYTLNPDGW